MNRGSHKRRKKEKKKRKERRKDVKMPNAADILSDPDISQAYEDVRSDKSETTWLILKVC